MLLFFYFLFLFFKFVSPLPYVLFREAHQKKKIKLVCETVNMRELNQLFDVGRGNIFSYSDCTIKDCKIIQCQRISVTFRCSERNHFWIGSGLTKKVPPAGSILHWWKNSKISSQNLKNFHMFPFKCFLLSILFMEWNRVT